MNGDVEAHPDLRIHRVYMLNNDDLNISPRLQITPQIPRTQVFRTLRARQAFQVPRMSKVPPNNEDGRCNPPRQSETKRPHPSVPAPSRNPVHQSQLFVNAQIGQTQNFPLNLADLGRACCTRKVSTRGGRREESA